jgi:hypothetical protein
MGHAARQLLLGFELLASLCFQFALSASRWFQSHEEASLRHLKNPSFLTPRRPSHASSCGKDMGKVTVTP